MLSYLKLWFSYPKLREAKIPPDEHVLFERVGEACIQLTIAGDFTPRSEGLTKIYQDPGVMKRAEEWLTERADVHARHEWRIERLEWAILIFVIMSVIVDLVLVFHSK